MAKERTKLGTLKAALKLIESRRRWTQRTPAIDDRGAYVEANSKRAVAWCAQGACDHVGDERSADRAYWTLCDVALELYHEGSVILLNDMGDRPTAHRKVKRVFREAIKREEARRG